MQKLIALACTGVLALAACGSDDGGGGGGSSSGAKDQLFDELMAEVGDEEVDGVDIDEGCMRDLVDAIPDDEAVIIVENLDAEEAPPGVSAATIDLLFNGVFDCVDIDFSAITDE